MKIHPVKVELHRGSSADFDNDFQHLCQILYITHIPDTLACTLPLIS